MNKEVLSYVILVGLSVIGIYNNSIAFNPLRFHCNNYILSTYLYFILSWGIALSTVTVLHSKDVPLESLFTKPFTILLFLVSLLLLAGLLYIPPQMFVLKHILFILELIVLGVTLYPLYVINKDRFNHVGLTTLLTLLVLSFLAYYRPSIISDNIARWLLISLFAIIIARLVEYFILDPSKKGISTYSRIVNYVSIAVFSLYILHDTKSIIRNSNECTMSPFGPDFIRESISLFLDSLNLFSTQFSNSSD